MKTTSKILTVCLVAATALTSMAHVALAQTNRALIVGVSKYDNLPENLWLSGPKNDAVLVRDFLTTSSPRPFTKDNIMVLADGVESVGAPTLNGIRAALGKLAEEAESGDFVYLHFSGHGSQAPALDPSTEIDGFDELFLPSDIGAWDKTTGVIENALVDDELGQLIDAIRAKGADVWAVFDSCHSGTVTRAANLADPLDREVSRQLSPAALGLDEATMDAARPKTRGLPTQDTGATVEGFADASSTSEGSFVAFFAAQTDQTTPELRLPEGVDGRQTHGLFTYSMIAALAQNPAISYQQLGQEIMRAYSVSNRPQPTPLFEGDLQLGVFSQTEANAVAQWPIKQVNGKIEIKAGRLHGLTEGEILGLAKTALQQDVDNFVRLEVSDLTDLSATLLPVSKKFALIEDNEFARKMETVINYEYTVAMPDPDQRTYEIDVVLLALDELDNQGLRLNIVEHGAEADVQFVVQDDILWFVGRDGVLNAEGTNKTPSVIIANKTSEEFLAAVGDNLTRMAKVNNLVKLGGIFRPSAMGIEVNFTVQNPARLEALNINPAAVSKLIPGDVVFMSAKNIQASPVDVNVLYIGSDFSITHLYNQRLNSNEPLSDLDILNINDESFGRERILVVATPAPPQSNTENLVWLEQAKLENTRAATRDGPKGLVDMLAQAGYAETTRGGGRTTPGGGIAQFLVDVEPELE